MTNPTEPITVQQTMPKFEAMQWLNQGDPNDPDVFPVALAISAGLPIWEVTEDGTLQDFTNNGFGIYPIGQWFISGAYWGAFPGWQQANAQPLADGMIGPGLQYVQVTS